MLYIKCIINETYNTEFSIIYSFKICKKSNCNELWVGFELKFLDWPKGEGNSMVAKKTTSENDKRLNKMINTIPGTLMYKGQKNEKFIIERFAFDDESLEHQFYEICNETFFEDIEKSKDE